MSELTFLSKKRDIIMVPEGEHRAIVTTIGEAISKLGTAQIAVKFSVEGKGSIMRWFNLQGYEKFGDEEFSKLSKSDQFKYQDRYKRDEEGDRIQSVENTDKAIMILSNFINDCGIPDGEEISLDALSDAEVGIVVALDDNNNHYVKRTMPCDVISEQQEMQ